MATPFKKVLITGVDGFTGKHLKNELLHLGYEVYGTSRVKSANPNIYQVDITEQSSIEQVLIEVKPDFIFHLAAISFVAHENAGDFYNINVIGTENLLKAIIATGLNPEKVLISSSANVYGNTNVALINEDVKCEPVNHYACSKLAMEKIVSNYFDLLNIIITRPFNYTGPNQAKHFLVPKIVSHFKQKCSEIELGNIDIYRDYSFVQYVVGAYIKLVESSEKSLIVNVCSGKAVSLFEIIKEMKSLTSQDIKVEINDSFVRKDEIKRITGDNTKLINIIGNQKVYTLKEILASFLN